MKEVIEKLSSILSKLYGVDSPQFDNLIWLARNYSKSDLEKDLKEIIEDCRQKVKGEQNGN